MYLLYCKLCNNLLPGRTARNKPTGSTCNISWRLHRQSHYEHLDELPPFQPASKKVKKDINKESF